MTKRKKQDKKADKSKEVTQKLNEIIVKKEKEKGKHVFRVKELIEALPEQQVRYRKDRFVKLVEGNVYLSNVTYGIQMLENHIGAPGKVIQRIETQVDFDNAVAKIKENVLSYVPREYKKLSDNDEVKIALKHKTREQLRNAKKVGESWDSLINRLLEK